MAKPAAAWAPRAALGLTALLLLSLSAVAGLLVWSAYDEEVRSAELRAANAAHVVATNMHWIGEAAFQSLRRVDDTLGETLYAFGAAEADKVAGTLSSVPGETPVRLIDANGSFIATSDLPGSGVNVEDRPYFQALRDGAAWQISPMLVARLTHEKVFIIGRRIERQGRFLGAATILIPAALLTQFWSSLDLGPDSAVGLIRSDGWLVARHPVPDEPISLADHPLFTVHLAASPSGTYGSAASPADGAARVVGFHTVEGLPLVATAGISHAAVMARFRERVGSAALVGIPVALALLATSIAVAVLLRRYERRSHELATALEQNRILFQEVHHRVKNNLTMVLSLIQMQPMQPEAKRELGVRIGAMAALHEQIYMSDQLGTVELSDYVRRLADALRHTMPARIEIVCRLADVEIDADQALPLGLIINEVTTNALKHGYPDGRRGIVTITLERVGESRARVQIRDDGVGFDVDLQASGMGSRLIHGLCQQIRAECAFRSDDGTEFTVEFPLVPRTDDTEPPGDPVASLRPEATAATG